MRYEKTKDALIVYLSGELDQCSAQSIRREMDSLLEKSRVRHLIIDMQDMTFMDSSGIGVILGRYRQMAGRGGKVSVRRMNNQVNRIFTLSGMGQVIDVLQ